MNSLSTMKKSVDIPLIKEEKNEDLDQMRTNLSKVVAEEKFAFDMGNGEEVKKEKKCYDHATQKKNILYYAFKDIRERYLYFCDLIGIS
jgi:hypothetical protein